MRYKSAPVRLWAMILALAVPCLASASDDLRLIEAVRNRDGQAARTLLEQNVDVNSREADGAAAIHWAAHLADQQMVDLLVGAGAQVDVQNDYGVTPLTLGCVNGDTNIIESLLKAGGDPNLAQGNGETPLMTCARSGDMQAVKLLLASGAQVDAREMSNGQTALMWAAAHGHPSVMQVLLENGADIHARTRVTSLRISRGRDPNAGRLQLPFDQPQGGFTALLFAARAGEVSSGRLLLEGGANVNDITAGGASVLVLATHSGQSRFVEFLLELEEESPDVDAAGAGYTALHTAVLRGDRDLTRQLLAHGADPNSVLENGTENRRFSPRFAFQDMWAGATPFLLAAKFADIETMRLLLEYDADPKAVSKLGATALMWAAGVDWSTGIKSMGAPQDRRGRTVSEIYDYSLDEPVALEAVTMVLDLGVDVGTVNTLGDTALHGAAVNDFHSVVEVLVSRGASMDVENGRGQTAAELLARPRQR